jgi:hypothetical protein
MSDKVDFSGYSLLYVAGLERQQISGAFTAEDLAQIFIDNWVPYYECHKCSRVDYCKFPQPLSPGSHRMRDIQCGVVIVSIKNFVHATFPILQGIDGKALQGFLDGAYYFTQFLFDAELRIGSAMDTTYIDYLEDFAPAFFGRIVHLRDYLNDMSAAFQYIPELHAKRGVLFVEGESEKAFVERLKLSHLAWFIDITVDSYKGKGNRRLARIEMLLEKYASQGYEIFVQGDADGRASDFFNQWIQRYLVRKENTIIFKHDFETAIPHELFFSALQNIGYLDGISLKQYILAIGESGGPIGDKLRETFNIDLDAIKVELAKAVADRINRRGWTWWNNENFKETELGRFLLFIRRIH